MGESGTFSGFVHPAERDFGTFALLRFRKLALDKLEDRTSSARGFGGAAEDVLRLDVMLFEDREEFVGEVFYGRIGRFVDFGENDGERDLVFVEPLDEGEVTFLRFEARVDERENVFQVFALGEVGADVEVEFVLPGEGNFCETVAGQVDEGPACVDVKEVNHLGPPRLARGFGELFFSG